MVDGGVRGAGCALFHASRDFDIAGSAGNGSLMEGDLPAPARALPDGRSERRPAGFVQRAVQQIGVFGESVVTARPVVRLRLLIALQQVGDDEVAPRRHGFQIVTARAEGTPMEYRLPLSEFA